MLTTRLKSQLHCTYSLALATSLVVSQLRCCQLHFHGKRAAGARWFDIACFLRSSTRPSNHNTLHTDPRKSFPFLSVRSGTGLPAHSRGVSRRNSHIYSPPINNLEFGYYRSILGICIVCKISPHPTPECSTISSWLCIDDMYPFCSKDCPAYGLSLRST